MLFNESNNHSMKNFFLHFSSKKMLYKSYVSLISFQRRWNEIFISINLFLKFFIQNYIKLRNFLKIKFLRSLTFFFYKNDEFIFVNEKNYTKFLYCLFDKYLKWSQDYKNLKIINNNSKHWINILIFYSKKNKNSHWSLYSDVF